MKISVIVPIYNAESTINRCVDSILEQSYNEFELILVNDGSKDHSGDICDEYARKDSRIKVIHKANGGVSSARNAGLYAASGEYITFIDSDDYIGREYLLLLSKYDFDLTISGLIINGEAKYPDKFEKYCYNDFDRFLNLYCTKSYIRAPWAKLFKNQIIKNHKIKFDDKLRWGEDYIFVLEYLKYCNNLALLPFALYNYDYPTSIGKYKFKMVDYKYGCIKAEKLLKSFNLNSFMPGSPLDINRLWHYYTMRDYISRLNRPERIKEWNYFIYRFGYKYLPKRSFIFFIKCIIEMYRVTHKKI